MIKEMIVALKAGQELSDPEKWKNRMENTNYAGAIIAGGLAFLRWKYPGLLPEDSELLKNMVDYSAELIGTILVMVNLYLNRATTKKQF